MSEVPHADQGAEQLLDTHNNVSGWSWCGGSGIEACMGDLAGWRQRMGKAGQGQAWAVGDPQELMGLAPPFCGKGGGGFSCMTWPGSLYPHTFHSFSKTAQMSLFKTENITSIPVPRFLHRNLVQCGCL